MAGESVGRDGRIRVGLALGSGGARGAAHVGVLKVLEREGIEVVAVAGSSIGAVVGGAYAAGVPTARIEEEWRKTNLPQLVRTFLPTFPRAGLSSGAELERYLRSVFGDLRIEDMKIPFAAVATDLDTGEAVVIRTGPLVDALRASTAIPGIFRPVRWRGRILVDGGMVEPVPVRPCRELGAEIVIGVDVGPRPAPTTPERRGLWDELEERLRALEERPWVPASLLEFLETRLERPRERPLPGLFSLLNQSALILLQQVTELKLRLWPPDVLVRPEFPRREGGYIRGYLNAEENIAAGERAMEAALPELYAVAGAEGR
ncbi:MAG: patatin [Caldiserica bacterium]|nr:patatin [Caldisericota bacterium]